MFQFPILARGKDSEEGDKGLSVMQKSCLHYEIILPEENPMEICQIPSLILQPHKLQLTLDDTSVIEPIHQEPVDEEKDLPFHLDSFIHNKPRYTFMEIAQSFQNIGVKDESNLINIPYSLSPPLSPPPKCDTNYNININGIKNQICGDYFDYVKDQQQPQPQLQQQQQQQKQQQQQRKQRKQSPKKQLQQMQYRQLQNSVIQSTYYNIQQKNNPHVMMPNLLPMPLIRTRVHGRKKATRIMALNDFQKMINRNSNFPSYEKRRITKKLEEVGEFDFPNSEPHIWMIEEFGRAITHKEFNSVYLRIRSLLGGGFGLGRDVTRSQVIRFKWLSNVWHNSQVRNVIQNIFREVMKNKYM